LSTPLSIHPGTALPAFRLIRSIAPQEFAGITKVTFEIFMYSENNHPLSSLITFTQDDFEDRTARCGKSVISEIERKGL
jgi:hypothetical protein